MIITATSKLVIAGVLSTTALGVIWAEHHCPARSQRTVEVYESYIGERLATEALRLSRPGRHILVVLPVAGLAGATDRVHPLLASQVNSFRRAVANADSLAQVSVEAVTADPMAAQTGAPAIPVAEFRAALERHPEAHVVVSIAGLPDFGGLPRPLPRLVVLCATSAGADQELETGLVQAALVPCERPTGSAGTDAAARFAREYEIKRSHSG